MPTVAIQSSPGNTYLNGTSPDPYNLTGNVWVEENPRPNASTVQRVVSGGLNLAGDSGGALPAPVMLNTNSVTNGIILRNLGPLTGNDRVQIQICSSLVGNGDPYSATGGTGYFTVLQTTGGITAHNITKYNNGVLANINTGGEVYTASAGSKIEYFYFGVLNNGNLYTEFRTDQNETYSLSVNDPAFVSGVKVGFFGSINSGVFTFLESVEVISGEINPGPPPPIGKILQSDQTISKGIARGIERGIV